MHASYKSVSQYSVDDLSQAGSVSEAMTPWGWRSILQQSREIREHVCSFRGHVGSFKGVLAHQGDVWADVTDL